MSKWGIIGCGRLGKVMARALHAHGEHVSAVWSRSGVTDIPEGIQVASSAEEVLAESDIILLTVPDGAIKRMAADLAETKSVPFEEKSVVHMSGALTSVVLAPFAAKGARTASFHPVQTLTGMEDAHAFENVWFGLEGEEHLKTRLTTLSETFRGHVLPLTAEGKVLYHAASSVMANYSTVLAFMAQKLLASGGICEKDGVRALATLWRTSVQNTIRLGTLEALTGPVSRGDTGTVSAHMEAIRLNCPELSASYRALGRVAAEMAILDRRVKADKYLELVHLLDETEGDQWTVTD